MSKKQVLEKINNKMDLLIIAGKTNTEEYKSLSKLHKTTRMEIFNNYLENNK